MIERILIGHDGFDEPQEVFDTTGTFRNMTRMAPCSVLVVK